MKNLFCLFLFVGWLSVSAQSLVQDRYKFGWKFGYTKHTITGGRVESKPKDYFEGGMWLNLKLSKKWTAQVELLFVEKGTGGSTKSQRYTSGYWVGLYYFEVPILFQYHIKKFMVEFGPGLGVLVYGHENAYGAPSPDMTDEYPFDRREVSFNFGIGFDVNVKWSFGLRFTHSILPVREQLPDISEEVYNRLLAFQFNRRLGVKRKKVEEDN